MADLITFAEHFGFTGFNVTFPYKQEIIPLLDELSEAAEMLGSVNTVVLRDGRRIGHNTDMWGFKESFRRGLAGAERREVLLLGAGGAGAAVAHALLESGVETLLVADVQADRAEALASRLGRPAAPQKVEVVSDLAAASRSRRRHRQRDAGRHGKVAGHAVRRRSAAPRCWVADIVYFPLETELLGTARQRGCRTLSGDGMAVFQAVRAFELFTGLAPDVERMKAAFAAFGSEPAADRPSRQHDLDIANREEEQ